MFESEEDLEQRLAEPSSRLVADLAALEGDLVVLGAGGKMGPSLCHLARRGLDAAGRSDVRVIAVSRWTDHEVEKRLRGRGVETVTFDLSPDADLSRLPDAGNVVSMVGAKFGSASQPAQTWAVNAFLPAAIARRYADARIAAFSTGNVYPLVPVSTGGCTETDPPDPVGEYAMSCLGRERAFEYASLERGTRVALLRLNYAVDMRYGVLADIARTVQDGEPVDVTTGHVNVVWQAYANEVTLRSLLHASSPTLTLNLTGPETLSVRRLAELFGHLLDTSPSYTGEEAPTALLSDASRCHALFGYPDLSVRVLVEAQADWLRRGGTLWNKPTKFQRRDGRF
ncbi:NAD-dependent epimerase/dehydratase family protein [Actinopolymorpha alba]|uniref:NAD-dependent epimerase/dehydratase family protein n=1 Tax=Actinopolymorpha alba TaxID=533267 RepID=UPI00037738B2|nr:NAD-dependent epimerase/dehydratase family protein [Actinopolymorpha alba]